MSKDILARAQAWSPDKEPNQLRDEDIIATPVFSALTRCITLEDVSKLIPIARELILIKWEEKNPPAPIVRHRFGHEDYAKLAGFGENPDAPIVEEANQYLRDHGYVTSPLKGGFLRTTRQMKNPNKNGVFELVIEEADPGSPAANYSPHFKATLYQYPVNGAKAPKIVFPPKSGDKNRLIINDDIVEVASMSWMMKQSILMGAQTPAIFFDLTGRIKALDLAERIKALK